MTSKDLFDHFMDKGTWVSLDTTVDQFIAGDPNREIKTIGVTWMSDMSSILWAINHNIDLLITHEPTYYNHFLDLENFKQWPNDYPKKKIGIKKEKLIQESGLVIMRNHDVWDRFPTIGIPYAWASFLGITSKPVMMGNDSYQHRYDITPITLGDLAKNIARLTESLGQNGVRVFGDTNQLVSKIGIGTGCACRITDFIEMGCDVSIVCDDGQLYWMDLSFAKDYQHPVIQVNHSVSEGPGMLTMCQYINDSFDDLKAFYIPHKYGAKLVTP